MMGNAMLQYFVKHGHECIVVVESPWVDKKTFKPYDIDGVKVSADRRALKGIDILMTHLDRTPDAEAYATKHNIPLVQVYHNHHRPSMAEKCDLAVYNTQWLLEDAPMEFDCDTVVVHPPVYYDHYHIDPEQHERRYITLVNLQKPKGVEMFYALAEAMPQYEFLGVKGSYGEQIAPPRKLANVTILDNQKDIRKVYAQTAIILMPSSYESYGRVAVEAACSGIPTIAHRTKGLWEALGEAGSFPLPDSDSWRCAVNYVFDTYTLRSRMAHSLAKGLKPEDEMAECMDAMQRIVDSYA